MLAHLKIWKVVFSRCEMTKTQLDPRSSIRACLCTEDFCNHDQTGKFCGCGEGDNYHHHLQSPVHQLDLKIFFPQQLHQIQNQESSALKSLSRWDEWEIALTPLLYNSGGNLCWLRWRLHGYRQLGRRTNDTLVLYFGWMKKKSQNSSKTLAFHNMFLCLLCWTTSFMFCSGAVGKGQAGVCTQKQRQVESWGRKHKSTEFNILWDELNTLWLKLNENPSWYFPWSIWVYMYHLNLIGPSFIPCAQSGCSIKK